MSWGWYAVRVVLVSRHGDGLGDKLVAQGSRWLRIQILNHDRDLAEVLASYRVFVFYPADKCRLVCLNTNRRDTKLVEQLILED